MGDNQVGLQLVRIPWFRIKAAALARIVRFFLVQGTIIMKLLILCLLVASALGE
jgi:hypothetical protein